MSDTIFSEPAEDTAESSAGDEKTPIRHTAIRLLSRREHSLRELHDKLGRKGYAENLIDEVLANFVEQDLQSDERFTESFVRYRGNNGFGPVRIRQELRERGIADELVSDFLDESDRRWMQSVRSVYEKRFGEQRPEDYKSRAKQMRYLQYRGFNQQQINSVFQPVD